MREGDSLFTLTDDPEEADYYLPPCGWQHGGSVKACEMADLAARHGKRLLIFFHHDSDEAIPIDGRPLVFRTSMYRSTKQDYEQAWPAWSCDVLRTYADGEVSCRGSLDRPVVGYCGYVDYRSALEWLSRTCRGGFSPGSKLRGSAVRSLRAASHIETHFILRRGFGGLSDAAQREVYGRNLLDCDYAIVARGQGNFSFRLYEAMSAAAIPVFIDTDCCLPFDDVIPYRDLFVWVPADEVHQVADHVLKFHARHDKVSLHEHRLQIRRVYEEYLEPLAFHRQLANRLTRVAGKS